MITIQFDDKTFFKDMVNILGYSEGFLDGAKKAEPALLNSIGKEAIQISKDFIDQQARIDPNMYHHIYEWYMEGSATGRLFDIEYIAKDGGLTFFGTLQQSKSIKDGSTTPFYSKASIMEKGISVTINPRNKKVLRFNDGTEEIFVSGSVVVKNPGGTRTIGSFERIFDTFFKEHFRQSVLDMTGISKYLSNAKPFSDNIRSAKSGGKTKGIEVGYNWIANAGGLNV